MSDHPWITKSLTSKLKGCLEGTDERIGFVLEDGSIVECTNICDDPENGFDVSDADLARYCDQAVATWHTHPDGTKLLSVGDHQTFRANHGLVHFIIAPDGLASYRVQNDIVLNYPVPE